jgi:hypothetical protein
LTLCEAFLADGRWLLAVSGLTVGRHRRLRTVTITRVRQMKDDDPRHGTPNGYGNLGCRCDACRAAHAINHAAYMKRKRESGEIVGSHGSSVAYDSGCRCDVCRLAHNARSVEKKRRIRERRSKDRL